MPLLKSNVAGKRLFSRWLIAAMPGFCNSRLYAQSSTITGKVIREKKDDLLGVTGLVKGTTNSPATDANATFPALSVSWNIKNDTFQENNELLSALKLRSGFAITGTEPTDSWMSLDRLHVDTYTTKSGLSHKPIGNYKSLFLISQQTINANPNLVQTEGY